MVYFFYLEYEKGGRQLDVQKLKTLLNQEENPKLDFKADLHIEMESDKKELAKDVIAMANSRGGRGYIVYGVEDKSKQVIGIDVEKFSEEQIQQILYNRANPPVSISVQTLKYEGKNVAVLTIYKSNQRPHQMIQNGAFYIRRGSTTDVAHRGEIATMLQQSGLFSYEHVILYNVSIEQLDQTVIQAVLQNDTLLLEGLGIIGRDTEGEEYHPTIGGLLLFGHTPYLFLPQVYIKVIYNEKVKLFTGNILRMLDEVEYFIAGMCNNEEYPLEALFEAITNAVVHRDYLDFSEGIVVDIQPNIIEIINPGAIVADNKIYNVHKETSVKRRNAWLYQRLLTIDRKNRFLKYGLGMKRIKQQFKGIGRVKFINLGKENLFKVVLPGFKQE